MKQILYSLHISSRILRSHKTRTAITILVISISMNFPISILALMDNAVNSSYDSLAVAGIDDVTVRYDTLVLKDNAIEELSSILPSSVGIMETRLQSHCRLSVSSKGLYASSTVLFVPADDTWFQGLRVDEGHLPSSKTQIAVGRDTANLFNISIGDIVNVTDEDLGLTYLSEVSGVVHDFGRPLSKYIIGLQGILAFPYDHQSNLIGLKFNTSLSLSAADYLDLAGQVAATIDSSISDAEAVTTKSIVFAPIQSSIESSRVFLFTVFCFSLVAAGSAAFSMVTVNLRESVHEIGLMKAIGFSTWSVSEIFLCIPVLVGLASALGTLLLIQPVSMLLQPFVTSATKYLFLSRLSYETSSLLAFGSGGILTATMQSLVPPLLLGLSFVMIGGWLPVQRSRNLTSQQAIMPSVGSHPLSKSGIRRRLAAVISIMAFQMLVVFRLPQVDVSLAEMLGWGTEIMTAVFLLSLVSLFWLLIYCTPSFLSRVRLPRSLGGDLLSLSTKSLRTTLPHYNSTVIAIAASVLVLLLSGTYLNSFLIMTTQDVYNENGGDLLVTGFHNVDFSGNLSRLEEVRSVSQILTARPCDTAIDLVTEVAEEGQILSFFCRNASTLIESIRWTSQALMSGLDQVFAHLDAEDGIILTTDLASSLGKKTGDFVEFNLTIGAAGDQVQIFSGNYQILGIAEFIPGIISTNPVCLLSSQDFDGLDILTGDRIIIKLNNPDQYSATVAYIQSLQIGLQIEISQLQTQGIEETIQVALGIFIFAGTVSILTLAIALFSLLVSRVIARRYEYGLIRAIGFTSRQSLMTLLYEGILVGVMGLVFGLLAYAWASIPSILSSLFRIESSSPFFFPELFVPIGEIVYVLLLVFITSLISSSLSLLAIRKRTAIELLGEEIY